MPKMNKRPASKASQPFTTSSYQEPSSTTNDTMRSLRKESSDSTASSETIKSNSHFPIHICPTITIGGLPNLNESVCSYSISNSDQSQSERSDISFCLSSYDEQMLDLSVKTDVPTTNIIPTIDRSLKKRHTYYAGERSPTPHFPQIPFSFAKIPSTDDCSYDKENVLEKTCKKNGKASPNTAYSNETRVSPKTIIDKDSPAYRIMKYGKCKDIRKYKFQISEKVRKIKN